MEPNDFVHLLIEMRDIQREHLEEYRRVTRESLELQRRAVRRQESFARLYRAVLAVGAIVVVALILLLMALIGGLR